MYSEKSLTRANTAIPGLGGPITAVDVTYDGKWVLATTKNYLMVVKTTYKVCEKCTLHSLHRVMHLYAGDKYESRQYSLVVHTYSSLAVTDIMILDCSQQHMQYCQNPCAYSDIMWCS